MRQITALGFILLLAAAAGATPPSAPTLRTTFQHDGAILVHWTIVGTLPKTGKTLEIQRATSGAFAPLVSISEPKRRASVLDRPAAGTWSYRARFTTADGTSAWSDPVTVDVASAASPPPPPPPSDGGSTPSGLAECPAGYVGEVFRLLNAARGGQHLGALALEPHLAAAARARAITIAGAQSLSHDGWVEAIRAAGYGGGALGENIAYGYATPAAVMNGWLGSPGHRANILGGYRDVGVGCMVDKRGRLWWTQDFGA